MRWGILTILLVGGCNCDAEIEAAENFLNDPANLACSSDGDCQGVATGCHTFERGVCAQAPLNKTAAGSDAWRNLAEDLDSCAGECTRCHALLLPRCVDGFCGGKP
jgi:hypothetical protein